MKRMKFYGLGGQGVVTAAKVLSTAVSLYEDKFAITVPSYGHERRGAPVYTDVVVDSQPILLNCYVYEPDIVMVVDETVIDKNIDVGSGRHDGTILVLNTADTKTANRYAQQFGFREIYYADATSIALAHIGRGIPSGAMLGALAKTGVVGIASVEAALREMFGEKAGDKNANAATATYEAARAL